MDDDVLNMEIRRFLKQVGVSSQREIERAVRDAVAAGKLTGSESITARARIELDAVGLSHEIKADIKLS